MGVLRDIRVEVVLNHEHDSSRVLGGARVIADWPCLHRVARPESVHVYVAVGIQFLREILRKLFVPLRWEVP